MEDYSGACFNHLSPGFKNKKGKLIISSNPQVKLILFYFVIFLFPHKVLAQELSQDDDLNFGTRLLGHTALTKPDVNFDSTETSVFGNVDSLFGEIQPKLFPENMSFMEKLLWGENGLTRKVGLVDPLSPEEREYELSIRRTMLTAHQIGGFTTLALMLTADYFGQRVIDGHRQAGDSHQSFVAATIISYSLTAVLAVLSPPPLIRRDEESTTSIHKTLAWIHAAGMIVTPILGGMIGGRRHFNISKAHFHQIAAYITTAVFASAMIVVTF